MRETFAASCMAASYTCVCSQWPFSSIVTSAAGKIQLLHLRVIHLFVHAYKVVMNTEPLLYPDGIGIPNCVVLSKSSNASTSFLL